MLNITSSSRYKINRKLIKKSFEALLTKYGISHSAVINIVFVGKNKMKAIASKYAHGNEALPVLSFSYLEKNKTSDVEKENVLGEIFICYPQAIILAAEKEKKVDDIIIFLIKHGIENIMQ